MKTAIIVLGYNRPDHLKSTLDALKRANLITRFPVKIYIDGAREASEEDKVDEVVDTATDFVHSSASLFDVSLTIGRSNRGLARSIADTITEQFSYYDALVVIEDDIVLDPLALVYTKAQLEAHKDDWSIQSIGLFTPVNDLVPVPFLTPRMMCWGWATWKGKWNRFPSVTQSRKIVENQVGLEEYYSLFVGKDSYGTLHKCLFEGKDVWACRWVLSHVIHQSFCLLPPKSLTVNIGLDGSGQNCGVDGSAPVIADPVSYEEIEQAVTSKPFMSSQLMQYFAHLYDKQCMRQVIDRNHPPVLERFMVHDLV